MASTTDIEASLKQALSHSMSEDGPPKLAQAMEYAVFPAGGRIRPMLCLAVANACHSTRSTVALAAATSLELLHCASLAHDDLPCFDNAALRRGRASVHSKFGEPLAVLTGDALLVLAFETMVLGTTDEPEKMGLLVRELTAAVGMPRGIIAGQAWESEAEIDLATYHRAKTSAMFIAACACGALSAGQDTEPWREVGDKIGAAYQAIDDVIDATDKGGDAGKPTMQDIANGRPNVLAHQTVDETKQMVSTLMEGAEAAIPESADDAQLKALLRDVSRRFSLYLERAAA